MKKIRGDEPIGVYTYIHKKITRKLPVPLLLSQTSQDVNNNKKNPICEGLW
jgi:hypothetical protein